MYNLCKVLSVSRKRLYNTLNKFIHINYIRKDENKIIILNKKQLYNLSMYILKFNKTYNKDFKFNI